MANPFGWIGELLRWIRGFFVNLFTTANNTLEQVGQAVQDWENFRDALKEQLDEFLNPEEIDENSRDVDGSLYRGKVVRLDDALEAIQFFTATNLINEVKDKYETIVAEIKLIVEGSEADRIEDNAPNAVAGSRAIAIWEKLLLLNERALTIAADVIEIFKLINILEEQKKKLKQAALPQTAPERSVDGPHRTRK